MRKRKGIYQGFDAAGNVTSDERWQIMLPDDPAAGDGLWQIEAEVTRIAPFPHPRVESLAGRLAGRAHGDMAWQTFSIHTRDGALEAGARFEADRAGDLRARFCWRQQRQIGQREFIWQTDCEIGYNSPLPGMVIVWRSRLRPGESRLITLIDIDAVTLEPRPARQVWSHQGVETLSTPYGRLSLTRYAFGPPGATTRSRLWCDKDGVIYDYAAADGGGFRLVAVNTPQE